MSRTHNGRRAVVAGSLVLVSLVAVACGDDDDDDTATPAPSTPTSEAPPSTSPAAPGATVAPDVPAPPFPADLNDDVGEGGGGDLGLASVRVARQDGYDRVVLEFGGDGIPGWFVGYVDNPTSQGSGEAVNPKGDSTLQVAVRHVGIPEDTGVPYYSGPRNVGVGDATNVREVVVGSLFEGDQEAFIGIAGDKKPFRVFALEGPPRLVIDVRDR